jgi:hypothetical protein
VKEWHQQTVKKSYSIANSPLQKRVSIRRSG